MQSTPVEIVSRTDTGRVRKHNEDSIVVLPGQGVAVLADGMGGYNAGEVASRLVAEIIAKDLLRRQVMGESMGPETLRESIERGNRAIFEAIARKPEFSGMATTAVVALFLPGRILYGHIGDSRLYRISDGIVEQLTNDHSMIQELVDQGMFFSVQEARRAGVPPNVLTRGLGVELEINPDVDESPVLDGDIYLLCSDGLSNMLADETILSIVSASSDDLERAANQLLQKALEAGGTDNISLILARSLPNDADELEG